MDWTDIPGWFRWRDAQEEAAAHFPSGSRFVEVGTFLGRSICSLAEVGELSGKNFTIVGVDTCLGSGVEGPTPGDFHAPAVIEGGGTFAGRLHRNVVQCGYAEDISIIVANSTAAAALFANASLAWVHLDAAHDRDSIQRDIRAWLPKVRPGGWLSGDDFDPIEWPQVVAAVTEALPDAHPWSTSQWRFEVAPRA